jgi:hypothetical protein
MKLTPTEYIFTVFSLFGIVVTMFTYHIIMPDDFLSKLQLLSNFYISILSTLSMALTPLFAYGIIKIKMKKINMLTGFLWGVSVTPFIIIILNQMRDTV